MSSGNALFLVKRIAEFQTQEKWKDIRPRTRGIYVLYQQVPDQLPAVYRVVYVGMAGGPKSGMRGRLRKHAQSAKKHNKWSHFTILEVHDNIPESVVAELEGIIRHIYRSDRSTHILSKQWKFLRLNRVSEDLPWN
jgi:hypothetical protein